MKKPKTIEIDADVVAEFEGLSKFSKVIKLTPTERHLILDVYPKSQNKKEFCKMFAKRYGYYGSRAAIWKARKRLLKEMRG